MLGWKEADDQGKSGDIRGESGWECEFSRFFFKIMLKKER